MEIIDRMIEVIIKEIMKKRFKSNYNKYNLYKHDDSHKILNQMSEDDIYKIIKAKQKNGISFSSDSHYVRDYAYKDGLAYAKKLFDIIRNIMFNHYEKLWN